MCAKIALYGIAPGHELAGVAVESGNEVDEQGIFGLSDDALEGVLHHPTMIDWAEHVKIIDTTKRLLENGQRPLLMLSAQVHEIEWMDEVEPELRVGDK